MVARPGAHPRLRGEHFQLGGPDGSSDGSSPLTRGARWAKSRHGRPYGLIPAYAGSTHARSCLYLVRAAHPRLRGEHPDRASARFFSAWLIPAYAGSTRASLPGLRATRAHPRLRGEHSPIVSSARRAWGSSPLTRGARHKVGHRLRGQGLIPAYAGSTAESHVGAHPVEAHPRLRGEHSSLSANSADCSGSSPLTRGAHPKSTGWAPTWRLIPAYAGSTWTFNDA